MTLAVYLGHESLTFSDYIDLDTGRTLAAVPGGTYDITPAGGRPVPDIPAGWFTPATGQKQATPAKAGPSEAAEDEQPGA